MSPSVRLLLAAGVAGLMAGAATGQTATSPSQLRQPGQRVAGETGATQRTLGRSIAAERQGLGYGVNDTAQEDDRFGANPLNERVGRRLSNRIGGRVETRVGRRGTTELSVAQQSAAQQRIGER